MSLEGVPGTVVPGTLPALDSEAELKRQKSGTALFIRILTRRWSAPVISPREGAGKMQMIELFMRGGRLRLLAMAGFALVPASNTES